MEHMQVELGMKVHNEGTPSCMGFSLDDGNISPSHE